MAKERYYEDLRKLQKRANQRMVRLEKEDKMKTPAYQAVQGKLEMIGQRKVKGKGKGRRFKESGKATYNEYEMQKKILEEFLGAKTSTVKQAREYYNFIYNTSDQLFDLKENGISQKDWLDFWDKMPDKKKRDGMLESDRIVEILKAFSYKKGNEKKKKITKTDLNKIVRAVKADNEFKTVYKSLGLNYQDMENVGAL